MKRKASESNSFPFPLSPITSGPSWDELPSFPAFPVGSRGSDIYVAVPTLVFVPVSGLTPSDRECALAEAVTSLANSGMTLTVEGAEMAVGFAPIAAAGMGPDLPLSGMRNELLQRLLLETGRWLDEASNEPKRASLADQASAEIRTLLAMFGAAGESGFMTDPSL